MQRLLLAYIDIVSWHNDLFSAYKEVTVAKDGQNLVKVLCEELNCASCTEALQMVQDRIADMECACEQLKTLALPAYQSHVTLLHAATAYRVQTSFHMTSIRYKMPGTSKFESRLGVFVEEKAAGSHKVSVVVVVMNGGAEVASGDRDGAERSRVGVWLAERSRDVASGG
ncbi:hypothetical protein R1sor_018807 [Riccia sorocarpa]|uniref:Uncharacterized protein n=1 Tax=Riccia sorocarpa TaxID=122646 RepID=A0ABD3IAQ3_9MARC